MNLSPVTGPSIDILLCPHRYTKKMNSTSVEIDLQHITSDFLDGLWRNFKTIADEGGDNPYEALKTDIDGRLELTAGQRSELISIIDEYNVNHNAEITCPDAGDVSFFGKLMIFFGINDGGYMPGLSDALLNATSFNNAVKEIKRKVTGEVYDTEFTRILCKSPEELMWIKAWEDWAKERETFEQQSYANKLVALTDYIRDR